ncbi:MAG: hypothetical protein ACOX6N_00445 [Patescibacteria group bacterium]
MDFRKYSSLILILLVLSAISFYAFVQIDRYLSLKEQSLKNDAVINCLRFSGQNNLLNKEGQITVSYPLKEIYTYCLNDQGYSTNWK